MIMMYLSFQQFYQLLEVYLRILVLVDQREHLERLILRHREVQLLEKNGKFILHNRIVMVYVCDLKNSLWTDSTPFQVGSQSIYVAAGSLLVDNSLLTRRQFRKHKTNEFIL